MKESEERALALMGLQGGQADEELKKTTPHLTNLHEDIQLNHQILHFFEEGDNLVGRKNSSESPRVVLGGLSIQKKHCNFRVENGTVTLSLFPRARVHVNGKPVTEDTQLHTLDRVIVGNHHVFLFVNPNEEEPEDLHFDVRERACVCSCAGSTAPLPLPTLPLTVFPLTPQDIDWEMANKEVNADQMSALTSGEGGEGGTETSAMEARLRELEERMKREREEAAKQAEQMSKVCAVQRGQLASLPLMQTTNSRRRTKRARRRRLRRS